MTEAEEEYWTEESYEEEEVIEIVEEEYEMAGSLTPEEEEQIARFKKMAKMGIPQGAVLLKMNGEGCSQKVIDAVLDTNSSPAPPPRAAKQPTSAPTSSPAPPVPDNSRAALNEQIKAMALKKSADGGSTKSKPTPVKQAPPPPKASSNPLANQVAMLAANRAKRMAGEDVQNDLTPELTTPAPRTSAPPPKAKDNPARVTRPGSASTTQTPVVASKPSVTPPVESPKKSVSKANSKTAAPAPVPVVTRSPASVTTTITTTATCTPAPGETDLSKASQSCTNDEDQHDFQKVKLKPAKKENVPPPAGPTTATTTPTETVITEVVTTTPGVDGTMTRTVTRTTTTTKTVKRVTKGEPTYEVTEYKCGCNIM